VPGTVSQLDPATGPARWQTALPGAVLGTGSINASGVLAVPMDTYGSTTGGGVAVIDASTGAILARLGTANGFSQPVFANGRLPVATVSGLTAYVPAAHNAPDDAPGAVAQGDERRPQSSATHARSRSRACFSPSESWSHGRSFVSDT
jgi:hypothetical protein